MIGSKPKRVACIGGGQLGRMMALEAPRLNIEMSFLDPSGTDCPAASIVPTSSIVQGSLHDSKKINELVFGKTTEASSSPSSSSSDQQHQQPIVDVVTVEIEHISVDALEQLEQKGVNVQPSSRVLRTIQDKYVQKEHLRANNIAVPDYVLCKSIDSIRMAATKLGLPMMLKSRKGGYDGRGNSIVSDVNNTESLVQAIQRLIPSFAIQDDNNEPSVEVVDLDLYAEGWIDFDCEIAVMVARTASLLGSSSETSTACYPAVNAIQVDSICRVVIAPAISITDTIRHKAEELAVNAIDSLGVGASGMFGVELFITKTGTVLLNEIAPRPHNTGHYTQTACAVNQFENHLRAVCGMPLGNTAMMMPVAAMINLLGSADACMETTLLSSNYALSLSSGNCRNTNIHSQVHWYGKKQCKSGRKMGHINVAASSINELLQPLEQICILEGIPKTVLPISSKNSALSSWLVGVIMGSHSDLPTMQDAIDILKQFQIPYEVDIVSAHRTPDKLMQYGRCAASRGIRVIIAGAGGAAHLPGMVASLTPIPVIGVPIKTSTLSGIDSLYSIVQMPKGIPVATVAIGNATNAGLLAVRILCSTVDETIGKKLQDRMMQYQTDLQLAVEDTSTKLLELGSEAYLQQMDHKNKSVNV